MNFFLPLVPFTLEHGKQRIVALVDITYLLSRKIIQFLFHFLVNTFFFEYFVGDMVETFVDFLEFFLNYFFVDYEFVYLMTVACMLDYAF